MKIVTSRDFEETQPIFSKPKGGSGTYVYRYGRLVRKSELNEFNDKRSELAAPYVMSDVPEHRNMRTGEMVTTRRRHREIIKQYDLVEVGNENMPQKTYKPAKGEIAREIRETIDQLGAGYVNPDEGVLPADYVEEQPKELDNIAIPDDYNDGDIIRTENSKD